MATKVKNHRLDKPADNTAYGPSWSGVTDQAPSKDAVYDKIETIQGSIQGVKGLDGIVAFVKTTSGIYGNYYAANYRGATIASRPTVGGKGCRYDSTTQSVFIYKTDTLYKCDCEGRILDTLAVTGAYAYLIGQYGSRYIFTCNNTAKRINMDTGVIDDCGFTGTLHDVNFGVAITYEKTTVMGAPDYITLRIYDADTFALINSVIIYGAQDNYEISAKATLISDQEFVIMLLKYSSSTWHHYLEKYNISTGLLVVSYNINYSTIYNLDVLYNELDGLVYYTKNNALYKTSTDLLSDGIDTGYNPPDTSQLFRDSGLSYGWGDLNSATLYYQTKNKIWESISYPTGGTNDGMGQIATIF